MILRKFLNFNSFFAFMKFQSKKIKSFGYRFTINENGEEIARAWLYVIKNDLHDRPYALLEDLFVKENYRRKGLGKSLLEKVIEKAKEENCYKIIATSRKKRKEVHKFYKKFGFKDYGIEFRMDLD